MHQVDQAEMLREWMGSAGITRAEAARQLGVKIRRLDCWLLPPDSKGRRSADEAVLASVRNLIEELAVVARREGQGRLLQGVDAARPFRFTRNNTVTLFPALFRCREPIPGEPGGLSVRYSFNRKCAPGGYAEKIDRLDPALDSGYVTIIHLKSVPELEGFIMAQLHAGAEAAEVCAYLGGFYAIRHQEKPSSMTGLVHYVSRCRTACMDGELADGYLRGAVATDGRVLDEASIPV